MKKCLIIFILLTAFIYQSKATHGYEWYFDFPYFKYHAAQLLGSQSKVPDMYPVAVKLNQYVKELVDNGKLKDKPVIYDILTSLNKEYKRPRYLLEVYESENAYCININYREFFGMTFSQEELVKTIDYFAHPDFEPFYCDTTMQQVQLSKDIFFSKVNTLIKESTFTEKSEYDIYNIDGINVKMIENAIRVTDASGKDITLTYPISQPIRFKDRIIFINNSYFLVFENGHCIKNVLADGKFNQMLCRIQDLYNYPKFEIYSDWMNLYKWDHLYYSYSYSKNRFYILK